MCRKVVKTCNVTNEFKQKIAVAGCTIMISNKSMQLLSYDDTIIHAISMTNNYKFNRFSQSYYYIWEQVTHKILER